MKYNLHYDDVREDVLLERMRFSSIIRTETRSYIHKYKCKGKPLLQVLML